MHCDTKENVKIPPTEIRVANNLDPKHGMVLLNNGKINFGAIMDEDHGANYSHLVQFFSPAINASEDGSDDKVLIRNMSTQKFVKLSTDGYALANESNAHNATTFFLEPM